MNLFGISGGSSSHGPWPPSCDGRRMRQTSAYPSRRCSWPTSSKSLVAAPCGCRVGHASQAGFLRTSSVWRWRVQTAICRKQPRLGSGEIIACRWKMTQTSSLLSCGTCSRSSACSRSSRKMQKQQKLTLSREKDRRLKNTATSRSQRRTRTAWRIA